MNRSFYMSIGLIMVSTLCACGDVTQSVPVDVHQQAVMLNDTGGNGIDDPIPIGCSFPYQSCEYMCLPAVVDPGRPGTCCHYNALSTCKEAGLYLPGDKDSDGVADNIDNCVFTPNTNQANHDQDTWGDACDNCPNDTNQNQYNADKDAFGDVCDPDLDNDGLNNAQDLCPLNADPTNQDTDGDGLGDVCDDDDDNDGVLDGWDNCDLIANPDQLNFDNDNMGNLCDPDIDNDRVPNGQDNCPTIANPNQENIFRSGSATGDACEHNEVMLERVRYGSSASSTLTKPSFVHWDNNNVLPKLQLKTEVATFFEPPRSKTRNIVFTAAGQQYHENLCGLSGQGSGYGFSKSQPSAMRTVNSRSLMGHLVEDGPFEPAESFMASAFDSQFNFQYLPGSKANMVNAYYDWLVSKVRPDNLETVFLAGHSRGGCLVARLAQKFQRNFPNVRLIVQLYDAVCARGELGVDGGVRVIDNPLSNNPLWLTRPIDFEYQFPPQLNADRQNLRFLNIVSGEPVVPLATILFSIVPVLNSVVSLWVPNQTVNSLSQIGDPDTLDEDNTVWYRRIWSTANHNWVDLEYRRPLAPYDFAGSRGAGIEHVEESCLQLNCP